MQKNSCIAHSWDQPDSLFGTMTRLCFKNRASSLFLVYDYLTSWKKKEKNNVPVPRPLLQMERQRDRKT